ncbi:MAG: hypothetical protein ACRDRO_26305 [Pseudonocardiaceae bacterium]
MGPETGSGASAEAVETFMEKVLGDYAGANAVLMAAIGDRLGLFKDLAARGTVTSPELAARTGLQERYVREWRSAPGSLRRGGGGVHRSVHRPVV